MDVGNINLYVAQCGGNKLMNVFLDGLNLG